MCAFTDALKPLSEINKSTPQNAAREISTKRHTSTVLVCLFVRLCFAVLGPSSGPSNDGRGQRYRASNGHDVCAETCDASQSCRTPASHTCLPRTPFDSKLTPLSKLVPGVFQIAQSHVFQEMAGPPHFIQAQARFMPWKQLGLKRTKSVNSADRCLAQ